MKKILLLLLAGTIAGFAQVAAPDLDRDGIPDTKDPCPYTRPGESPISLGCSALDVAENPGQLTKPIMADLEEIVADLKLQRDDLRDLYRVDLLPAISELKTATARTASGDLHGSISGYSIALSRLSEALTVMQKVHDAHRLTKGASENITIRYTLFLSRIKSAHQRAVAAKQIFDRLGSSVRGYRSEGVITKIDDASRRIEIDKRIVVGMATSFVTQDSIYVGRRVVVNGPHLSDNTVLANNLVVAVPGSAIVNSGAFFDCMQIRVLPVQRMEPGFQGPFLKHRLDGYLLPRIPGGGFVSAIEAGYGLEEGMAIGAEDTGCHAAGPGRYRRYSLDVKLGNSTIALDLDATDLPVRFSSGGTLTVTTRVREGSLYNKIPDRDEILMVRQYRINKFDNGEFCEVGYSTLEFAIEENDNQTFGETSVDRVAGELLPLLGPGMQFYAEGYPTYLPGPQSSFPSISGILFNTKFAIYNHDFYKPGEPFNFEKYGVTGPVGLRFPRIHGMRNGSQVAYSCWVHKLVRDYISLATCPGPVYPTALRLPFQGFSPTWTVGADPGYINGMGTDGWRFDLSGAGSPILAARGGTVEAVGDHLIVRHQGTRFGFGNSFGVYSFINSTLSVGDTIKRGAVIGFKNSGTNMRYVTLSKTGYFLPFAFQIPLHDGTIFVVNCQIPRVGVPF